MARAEPIQCRPHLPRAHFRDLICIKTARLGVHNKARSENFQLPGIGAPPSPARGKPAEMINVQKGGHSDA